MLFDLKTIRRNALSDTTTFYAARHDLSSILTWVNDGQGRACLIDKSKFQNTSAMSKIPSTLLSMVVLFQKKDVAVVSVDGGTSSTPVFTSFGSSPLDGQLGADFTAVIRNIDFLEFSALTFEGRLRTVFEPQFMDVKIRFNHDLHVGDFIYQWWGNAHIIS